MRVQALTPSSILSYCQLPIARQNPPNGSTGMCPKWKLELTLELKLGLFGEDLVVCCMLYAVCYASSSMYNAIISHMLTLDAQCKCN